MKALLLHSYETSFEDGPPKQVLSIFIACHNLNANEFDSIIARALGAGTAPVSVHFVGYQEDIDKVRAWLGREEDVTAQRLLAALGSHESALCFIAFEVGSGSHVARRLNGSVIADSNIPSIDRQQCLLAAFREAGGEQRAPVGTHFAKTSESHSERFLRVSNVLEEGANVRLLAFWLMPRLWKSSFDSWVVDTSGIYSIALTAMHEAGRLGGLVGSPLLWSHRSHEGVAEIEPHHASAALCLVSASTSGGLVQKLVARGVVPDRIVTIFSLSSPGTTAGHVLCDLLGQDGSGITPIQNYKASSCPLCAQHFHLIGIHGDQFSISPPNVTLLEIKAADLPAQIKVDTAALFGLRAFVAYRRRAEGRIASLGVRVDPILHGELTEKNRAVLGAKRERWTELVRRYSAVSVRHVVAASYPGSMEFAEGIATEIRDCLRKGDRPIVVSPELLRAAPPESGTSTIVIAACVDNSNELLSVSRTLRDIQENGSTSYLVVADLIVEKAERDRLRSNLTFGHHGPGTFSLHTLFCLPLDAYEEQPSWEAEVRELQRLMDWADQRDMDVPKEIEQRILILKRAPAEGLIDDLFWPAADGQALCLRSDFTLVPDARRDPTCTQADLFAAMSLLLSVLRHNTDANRRLTHNAYERVVLSPHNFDRYNDGVLQASILRAAYPKELAYGACDPSVSERMLEILKHTLPDEEVPEKSEALTEFLVALLTRRMTLHSGHLVDFCRSFFQRAPVGMDTNRLIASYLIDRESVGG